jgi:hypothetical protein
MKKIIIFSMFFGLIFAKKEFEPLYTGSLLTPSADCVAKGSFNVQPYLYIHDEHRFFDSSWHKHSGSEVFSILTSALFQYGLTKFIDLTITPNAIYQKKDHVDSFQFADISMGLGFQILKDKKHTYIPSLRIYIAETFPTGKYQKLNPKKLWTDAAGSGSYITKFELIMSKITYFIKYHPIRFRLASNYSFPTTVKIKDFNSYGGGYKTDGKVKPPSIFELYFSFEFSLTKKWVVANDLLYHHTTKSTFSGIPGITTLGKTAKNYNGSTEQISIAPAIEYNFSKNGGVLAGVWFPLMGKNTADFVSYVFSFTIGY